MSSKGTVLYDVARRGGNNCWSANVWKVRLVLNYKRIPYTTIWLSHPEIEPTVKSLGLPPNPAGPSSPYTVPVIRLPDGEYIMESTAIVRKLEELYPQPSLHLDTGLHEQAAAAMGRVGLALIPVFMPRVGWTMIVESSVPWFKEAREKRFGMSLQELEATRGGELAWKAAEPGLAELKGLFEKNKRDEGDFVLGSSVSYADFVVVGALEGFRRIGEDMFKRFVEGDEGMRRCYEACRAWLEKDQ